MTSDAIRHKDKEDYEVNTPQLSEQLNDFLSVNELSLAHDHSRSELIKQLRQLKDTVPVVHMTFATVADRESLGALVSWLRESAHPQTVVAIGLQPALVAGVYVRTPNQVHDFSMRARLKENHEKLLGQLEELRGRE
jgi:F0F1-type ATP synthase delta subunit